MKNTLSRVAFRVQVFRLLTFLLVFLLFGGCAAVLLQAQIDAPVPSPAKKSTPASAPTSRPPSTPEPSTPDLKGSLSGANLYTNPALSMTLQLTGEWQIMDEETRRMAEGRDDEDEAAKQEREAKRRSECTGPLCGTPEIDVALITQPKEPVAVSSIFMVGFKLTPQYLDRERYPLKSFADIMIPGSLGGTGLEPADSLAAIQLGERPAYRSLVREPGAEMPKEVGYVVESNGYMVLLVGSVANAVDLAKLLAAIENVKFEKTSN